MKTLKELKKDNSKELNTPRSENKSTPERDKIIKNSFYEESELKQLGFKQIGKNVRISRKASFYGVSKISIGNNVRIDDFCILSGKIDIGNYIHIAAYSALYGGDDGIFLDDFVNISSRVCIYSVSDDYSGNSMTNPYGAE